MTYIGLDIGTTGCKASVIDQNGVTLYSKYCEYNLIFPSKDWVEIDAGMVWQKVCLALSELAAGNKSMRFDAIAVGSFGESVVLLDKDDKVIGNSIFYTDSRGNEEIRQVLAGIEQTELQNITGMPVHSMYSINKLLWIRKHRPEQWAKAERIMLFADYIGYMLTGKAVIDYSLASRSMMFDIHDKTWSKKIFRVFGFNTEAFSRPDVSGTVVGTVLPRIAAQLSLNDDIKLVLGAHDQACAAVGAGALQAGDAVDSIGAAECITAVIDREKANTQLFRYNFCCEPHAVPGKYITLAFHSSAGAAIKWYRDTFEQERYKYFEQRNQDIYRILDEECGAEPSEVYFLPHLAGSGTPMLDSRSRGAFLGLTLGTAKNQIYKSILEGICFETKLNTQLLEECGIRIDRMVSVGGGARSKTLLSIKSHIMGLKVCTLEAAESGAMGLAILCAYAMEAYGSIEQAAAVMVKEKGTCYPDSGMQKKYGEKFQIYRRIYPALKNIHLGGI